MEPRQRRRQRLVMSHTAWTFENSHLWMIIWCWSLEEKIELVDLCSVWFWNLWSSFSANLKLSDSVVTDPKWGIPAFRNHGVLTAGAAKMPCLGILAFCKIYSLVTCNIFFSRKRRKSQDCTFPDSFPFKDRSIFGSKRFVLQNLQEEAERDAVRFALNRLYSAARVAQGHHPFFCSENYRS